MYRRDKVCLVGNGLAHVLPYLSWRFQLWMHETTRRRSSTVEPRYSKKLHYMYI